ncbi:MAG: MmcQ/YjbR family DNA-binding protein [Actinobacteria bacterium]|nr:MmcQ/YjbR family DNA-binding protein [Actinomycetota bacterium]MBW3647196.1 MmcQ/YjbR family DNA-binding protein [Actinomycetota bacterium]
MPTWDDVRRAALELPGASETSSRGLLRWTVKEKGFAWERPLRTADREALGDDAPDGPVLGVRVADVGVKESLVSTEPEVYFTTPHFDGYPAVLVRLERIPGPELVELVIEAWLASAPKRMARAYLDAHQPDGEKT